MGAYFFRNTAKKYFDIFLSGPILFDRRHQCASFEPLVIYFGPGPLIASQPELTGLVVDGPKSYKNMVQNNP